MISMTLHFSLKTSFHLFQGLYFKDLHNNSIIQDKIFSIPLQLSAAFFSVDLVEQCFVNDCPSGDGKAGPVPGTTLFLVVFIAEDSCRFLLKGAIYTRAYSKSRVPTRRRLLKEVRAVCRLLQQIQGGLYSSVSPAILLHRQKTVGREVRHNAFPVTPKTLSIVIM